MAEDILQQVAGQAPAAGVGSVIGGGGIIAALKVFGVFASPKDIELVEARLKAEFAEKYVSKENLEAMLLPLREDLHYIRQRIDQIK